MAEEDLDMETGEEAGGEQSEEKKGGGKLIIIIIVLVVVLFGGGFAGWWFFLSGPDEAPADKQEQTKTEDAEEKDKDAAAGEQKPGTIVDMKPFVVNLADPGGKRYLKLTMAVDAGDEKLRQEIESRMPQIRDSILLLLTSKKYEDVAAAAGKIRLKNELLKVINRYLKGAGAVHAIYFTEFVIQ